MPTIIKPTIGRKVWYHPRGEAVVQYQDPNNRQPLDATVIYVWDDRCVNLRVTDHAGATHTRTSVRLVQGGDEVRDESYATWMPYQVGQAAKAAT